MLDPRDRRLFVHSLRPPESYALDRAIATTFTLNLVALMAATLEFAMFDRTDDESSPALHPTALLEAVRRHADRIHVFCQAGQIAAPPKNCPLLAHLEGSVIEVRAPRGGLFHPKVWVLRFTPVADKSEPVRYRLLVLSRNLTFDRCWDTMVALEGEVLDRKKAIAMNHPLADFVQELPSMALGELPLGLTESVAIVQDELRRVAFSLPPDVEELAFWPLGLRKGPSWPFKKRVDRMLVVSPFVSPKVLQRLNETSADNILISRLESLAAIEAPLLKGFSSVHVINDAAFSGVAEAPAVQEGEGGVGSDAGDGSEEHARSPHDALIGLHAKLFVADSGWDARIWAGSANATDGAFGNNVEFLVELGAKKGKCGIDAVLGKADATDSLRSLLQAFQPGDVTPPDAIEDGLRSSIEKTRQFLYEAGLRATVERPEAQRFVMTLHPSIERGVSLPFDVTVRVWPVTIGEGFSVGLTSYAPGRTQPLGRYADLSVLELTSFFAIHVLARRQDRELEERFALNLPLQGAPADRRELLLKSLLKNREALIRYLMFLLVQAGADVPDMGGSELPGTGNGGGTAASNSSTFGLPLFETLLQALHRDPSKLDHVERVVADLAKTAEGRELLPKGFEAIWEPILAVRKEMRG